MLRCLKQMGKIMFIAGQFACLTGLNKLLVIYYNLGQNCWDTSEWMRTLALNITYHNKSFPLYPLISMLLCHQKPPDESLVLPNNIDWGEGGEGKHFCDLIGVSIHENWEIRPLIAFVSTSFVQDCVQRVSAVVQDMRCFQKSSIIFYVGFTKADFLKPFLVK